MIQTVKELAEWRAQALEALGFERPGYAFQPQPGGEVFTVPHPMMIDDDRNEAVMAASGNVAIAKALLGEAVYGRFASAGGRGGDVLMAWRLMQQGIDVDPNSSVRSSWSETTAEPSNPTSPVTVPVSAGPSISGGEPSSEPSPSEVTVPS